LWSRIFSNYLKEAVVIVRDYKKNDAGDVGLLIKNTYSESNLDFLKPGKIAAYLAPFAFA